MKKRRYMVVIFLTLLFVVGIIHLFRFLQSSNREKRRQVSSLHQRSEKTAEGRAPGFSAKKKLGREPFESEETDKSDEPDMFAKYQRRIRTRDGDAGPKYRSNYLMEEFSKAAKRSRLFKSQSLAWIDRGPGNVSGRTRGIVVDASDATKMTWFAGSVSGGVWKTTDAGRTWRNKTEKMPNLATTVLVQSQSNPDIIYCGTGEGFFNADAVSGSGIFKSTDHGETWNQLASTANGDFGQVFRMTVDPHDPKTVLAAVISGLYRSTDGGVHWNKMLSNNNIQDLKADPGNFLIQYAAVKGDGVYKSTDAGLTWQKSGAGLNASGRIEIAVSVKNSNYIYAAAVLEDASALYVSKDAAATWSPVTSGEGEVPNWLDGQGWYDNTIEVHPYDEKTVFIGGIDIWKAELTGETKSAEGVSGIDEENTESFMELVNCGLPYHDGGIGKGVDFYNFAPFSNEQFNLTDGDYVSVEFRFGPGKFQKAHRFVKTGSGSTQTYEYKDYVAVPFEAWDITHNRQIMISFRDSEDNGVFNLGPDMGSNTTREYLSVHAIDYNSMSPSPDVARDNGIVFKNIWSMWPCLSSGIWSPESLPNAVLRIRYGAVTEYSAAFTAVTNGYPPFEKPYVHVDHHNLIAIPKDPGSGTFWILNGNDGGVASSTDGGATWREALGGGYNTTQFYGVDKKPGASEYIGGTQDNGTWLSPAGRNADGTTAYLHAIGGDGFDAAWHHGEPDKIIGSSQFNNFFRTTDGGATWVDAKKGLDDVYGDKAPFISKIAESNSDPDVIYTTGVNGIWRSENFGGSWTRSGLTSGNWNYNGLSIPVAVSIADPQIVWAGSWFTNTESSLFLSTDGGLTFSSVKPNTGASLGTVTGIDSHPTDPQTAYLTFSFAGAPKILRTTDLGNSWKDISGFASNPAGGNGFPNVATYCVAVMPYNTDILWAGTEIGLFESTDKGASWRYADNGLPAVCIWDMKIVDDQVVAATHGRGIFTVTLNELKDYKPPAVTLSPIIKELFQSPDKSVGISAGLRSGYDSTLVMLDGDKAIRIGATTAMDTTLKFMPVKIGASVIQLISYFGSRVYKSSADSIEINDLKSIQMKYANNFDSQTGDFTGNGFSIRQYGSITSPAIHSLHGYAEKTEYVYLLTVPIEVASEKAFIEYDDIAVVEPGEPGSPFGNINFYDYVVIEGSRDGVNWRAIENGYDCRYNAKWEELWQTGAEPTDADFVHHKINLLDKFNAGDVILLRFRLYSDDLAVGWGWVVDNLTVQSEGVMGVENGNTTPVSFGLSQNYPNPFNPVTRIAYQLPVRSFVVLKIYDVLGREIATPVERVQSAGRYDVSLSAADLGMSSGVYFYKIKAGDFSATKKMLLLK